MYLDFKNNNVTSVLGYNQGVYSGAIQNESNYYQVEEYLVELEVIEKKAIKENISYNDYIANFKLDEYILLVISNEDVREEISGYMGEVFPNVKQDTINKRSELGEKILIDLSEKTNVLNVYPQVFYIKNGKVILNESVFSKDSFVEFKSLM